MDADCPAPLATYPGAWTGSPQTLPYLVLHRMGFTKLPRSPGELVRSYRTFSPLLRSKRSGILSVALSFASPRLHVMEHPALRCSDFPQDQELTLRSSGLLRPNIIPFPSKLFSDNGGRILCCQTAGDHYTSEEEYSCCIRGKLNLKPAQLQFL